MPSRSAARAGAGSSAGSHAAISPRSASCVGLQPLLEVGAVERWTSGLVKSSTVPSTSKSCGWLVGVDVGQAVLVVALQQVGGDVPAGDLVVVQRQRSGRRPRRGSSGPGCGSSGRRGCRRCRTRARWRPRCPAARPARRAAGSWRGRAACSAAPRRTGCRCRCRPPSWSCRTARRSRPAAARRAGQAEVDVLEQELVLLGLGEHLVGLRGVELRGVLGRDDAHRRLGRVGQGALRTGPVVALARLEHRVGRPGPGSRTCAGAAVDAPVRSRGRAAGCTGSARSSPTARRISSATLPASSRYCAAPVLAERR